ncbi:hypothetical protein F383_02280 [Gossypium arboreum]|uniref:Uncharacterized protein n=1 Tax=Gossypium arboreum TaxID=29729 RepID=A0A0B0P6V6_GOSAR|nr:hypothetical protein F383_02280 [Gossypium arboreum]
MISLNITKMLVDSVTVLQ